MSPIVKHGYVSDEEKAERQRFYNSALWRETRDRIRKRDGDTCRFCGSREMLTVAHEERTMAMVFAGTALDDSRLFTACKPCHNRFAAGILTLTDLQT